MHGTDPAELELEAGHRHTLPQRDAREPRALGQGLGDVGRIGLPVGRQERGTHDVLDGHRRPQRLRLAGGEQVHLQPEGMGSGRLAAHLGPAIGRAG